MSSLIAVVGMKREAKLLPPGCDIVLSGGGDNAALEARLEAAIARGGKAILSVGICGALTPGLRVGAAIVAREIVFGAERHAADGAWRQAIRARIDDAIDGAIAGSDAILTAPSDKTRLYARTGAIAADLESHIAARLATRHGLPFAGLRVVSDAVGDLLPPATLVAMGPDGGIALNRVLWSVLTQPSQIPALIRTGRNADKAFAELLRCLDLLGPWLGCPYIG